MTALTSALRLVRSEPFSRAVFLVSLLLLLASHLHLGRLLQAQTNRTAEKILGGDQKHNMQLAHEARVIRTADDAGLLQRLPHHSDGVVAPLWPWMASHLPGAALEPGPTETVTENDARLFTQGRRLHLRWTALFLGGLGLLLARLMTRSAAFTVTAFTGLAALLPRSAFFQPEPVLYALFLLAWTAALLGLATRKPGWHAACGGLAGLAFLAKSSAQPMLLVLGGVLVFGGILSFRNKQEMLRRGVSLALLFGAFLLTSSPRLLEANRKFGDPFHSYPSYWMWMDDFDECFLWMNQHPDAASLAADTSKPSLVRFVREKGIGEFAARLTEGGALVLGDFLEPGATLRGKKDMKPWKGIIEHRWISLGVGFLSLAVLAWLARRQLNQKAVELGLFVAGTFLIYVFAFGFYTPIGKGDRFLLLLFAPLLLSFYWAGDVLVKQLARPAICNAWILLHLGLLATLAWRVVEILRYPVFYAN